MRTVSVKAEVHVTAFLDLDEMSLPILLVSRNGAVTANDAFREALGHHDTIDEVAARFDVTRPGTLISESAHLPWERALRQDFREEQIWYDRANGVRLHYVVRGGPTETGAMLVFEDLSRDSLRLATFTEAVTRAILESGLEAAGAQLAGGGALAIGADAVFLFVPTSEPTGLRVLASSAAGVLPGVLAAAVAATRERARREVPAIDHPHVTCAATRTLLCSGLRSLVAMPLVAGLDLEGALVACWRDEGTPYGRELRTLDVVAGACAAVIADQRARGIERAELQLLQRLRAASLAITSVTSSELLMKQLATQACDLVGARRAAVGMVAPEAEQDEVVLVESGGREAGAAGLRDARQVIGELLRDEGNGHGGSLEPTIGARLQVASNVVGGACVFASPGDDAFTHGDARVLEQFAPQAALAIGYCQQVQAIREAQHRLTRLQDELTAMIAHEMRAPVSSILLQLDLLLDPRDREGDHVRVPISVLRRLRDGGRRTARMVDDLLDASRIELRSISLDRRRVSLREAIDQILNELEPVLHGRAIEVDARADVPAVLADPLRLDEIVTNLLENAVKYSSPGTPIVVRIAPAKGGAELTVEDEGSGIAPDELPRLFDRFFQASRQSQGRATKKSGLGLGLYIAKGLVEAHQGQIWAESSPGHGSRFHVWLPAAG
jgi:signal transduction histidine kinase